MSPYQGEQDGISAGGKWMMFQSEDKMTAAKHVRFELLAENYFREDTDYRPESSWFARMASTRSPLSIPRFAFRPTGLAFGDSHN